MIERILAPLDGSLTAEAILPQVQRLARRTGAEIVLARAVPVRELEGSDAAFRAAVQAAQEYLAGIQDRLEASGFRSRAVVRSGGAAETVLGLAGEIRADLLAVATHGRTGATRLVLGSVAETILRSTPARPPSSWLIRTSIVARTTSSGATGPTPPTWLRSKRIAWALRSSGETAIERLAPTPVVMP